MPVAAIVSVLPAGAYRHHRGTTITWYSIGNAPVLTYYGVCGLWDGPTYNARNLATHAQHDHGTAADVAARSHARPPLPALSHKSYQIKYQIYFTLWRL